MLMLKFEAIFFLVSINHRIISLVEKWNHSEGTPQVFILLLNICYPFFKKKTVIMFVSCATLVAQIGQNR